MKTPDRLLELNKQQLLNKYNEVEQLFYETFNIKYKKEMDRIAIKLASKRFDNPLKVVIGDAIGGECVNPHKPSKRF